MFASKQIALLILFLAVKISVYAQCSMCRAVLESDLQAGGTAAKGINEGIIYLMLIPYLLMGTVGYFVYKHYKKNNLSKNI